MITIPKNIIKTNGYYLIGIYLTDNTPKYQLLQIVFKNNELKVEGRCYSNRLDDAFKDFFKKDYPVILHLEGDNIINKVVENKLGYRNNVIFKADPEDFYFFEYHQESKVFVSVIRKHIINDSIALLKTLKLYTINVSFGPFVMSSLIPLAKENGYSSILSSNYSLQFNENKIQSFENNSSSQENFNLGGEVLNPKEVPLIAAFLNHKYPNEAMDFDIAFLEHNKSEFKFKKWFKVAGIFTLVFILTSLFVSNTLLNSYLSNLAEKESTYAISQQTILRVDKLSEEKALKEKILQTSGANFKNFITKYVVDIGNSVPNDITLKTLNTIPVIRKINPSKKINFDFSIVRVSGETTNDNTFNNWVKRLKTYSWVNKLEIVDYTQESKYVNSFVIKIKI